MKPKFLIQAGFRKAPALQITDDEGVAHEDDIVDYLVRDFTNYAFKNRALCKKKVNEEWKNRKI